MFHVVVPSSVSLGLGKVGSYPWGLNSQHVARLLMDKGVVLGLICRILGGCRHYIVVPTLTGCCSFCVCQWSICICVWNNILWTCYARMCSYSMYVCVLFIDFVSIVSSTVVLLMYKFVLNLVFGLSFSQNTFLSFNYFSFYIFHSEVYLISFMRMHVSVMMYIPMLRRDDYPNGLDDFSCLTDHLSPQTHNSVHRITVE